MNKPVEPTPPPQPNVADVQRQQLEAAQHEIQKFLRLANKYKDQIVQLEIQLVDREIQVEKMSQQIQALNNTLVEQKAAAVPTSPATTKAPKAN